MSENREPVIRDGAGTVGTIAKAIFAKSTETSCIIGTGTITSIQAGHIQMFHFNLTQSPSTAAQRHRQTRKRQSRRWMRRLVRPDFLKAATTENTMTDQIKETDGPGRDGPRCEQRLVRSSAVQRCKYANSEGLHARIHAAVGDNTLCGLELNEMWLVHSLAVMTGEDATCPKCRKNLRSNVEIRRERSELS
jgi:hypothetical protein